MSEIKVPSNGNLISFGVELYKVFMKRLKESFARWDAAASRVEGMQSVVQIENEYMEDMGAFVCAGSVTADVINDILVGDRLKFVGDTGEWGMALGAECVVTNLRGSEEEFTSQEVDFVFTDDGGDMWSGKLGMVDDRARVRVRRVGGSEVVIPGYEGSSGYEFSPLMSLSQVLPRLSPGTVVGFVNTSGQDVTTENLKGRHMIVSVNKDADGTVNKAIFVTLGSDKALLWTITGSSVAGHTLLKL